MTQVRGITHYLRYTFLAYDLLVKRVCNAKPNRTQVASLLLTLIKISVSESIGSINKIKRSLNILL